MSIVIKVLTPLEVFTNEDYFDWPSFMYFQLNLIQTVVIVKLLTELTNKLTLIYTYLQDDKYRNGKKLRGGQLVFACRQPSLNGCFCLIFWDKISISKQRKLHSMLIVANPEPRQLNNLEQTIWIIKIIQIKQLWISRFKVEKVLI